MLQSLEHRVMSVFEEFFVTMVGSIGASGLAYVGLRYFFSHELKIITVRLFAEHWADRIFAFLFLCYVLIFGALALLRYFSFHTGYLGVSTAWDLGQYSQLIWNSLNGRLLEGSFVTDTRTFLGKSFTPILLAFVPLYAVIPSPVVLLIVQTLGLGLGAFPIYWLARERLGRALALVVALAYFLSPGLENIGLTEFHEIALATPLLAYATYFLLRQHFKGFCVSLVIALLVKEEIALIAIIFGAYIFLVQRKRWLGLALSLFGAAWILVLLQFLIPFFRGPEYGSTFYYFGQGAIGGGGARYSYLGRSVPEILTTVLTQPGYVWQYVWVPEKIEYVLHLLVPLAFLPLVGFEVFGLALPTFGYSLLSTYGLQYSIRSYYFAPLLPLLFFAAVVGLRRLVDWSARTTWFGGHSVALKGALAVLLLSTSGAMYFLQAPGPLARDFQSYRYVLNEHTALGNALMNSIPSDAIVIGQNEFLAHLSNRQFLYEIPVIPDYRQADYLVGDATPGTWYYIHEAGWRTLLASGYFETVVNRDGYVIARRKTADHALNVQYANQMTLLGYSMVVTDTKPWGMTLRPVVEWRADGPITEAYQIVLRVVDQQGHVWVTSEGEPQDGAAPTNRWQVGKSIGDQYTLRLPPTMPTDDYLVTVAVCARNRDECLDAREDNGRELGGEAKLASVRVEKNKGSFTASDIHPSNMRLVDMGEMRFLGYELPRGTIQPSELLQVGVYWRAREKPRGDYLVTVQLRDAVGQIAFEQTSRPANGNYATLEWDVGEVLLDWHDLNMPQNIAEGEYQLSVFLRNANTGQFIGETPISTITIHR